MKNHNNFNNNQNFYKCNNFKKNRFNENENKKFYNNLNKKYKKNKTINTYIKKEKEDNVKASPFLIATFLFILFVMVYLFIVIPYEYINIINYGHYKRFAFQVGNLNVLRNLLGPIDNSMTTSLAYPLRHMLMFQYKNIYKTNGKDLYNPIGCFYLIDIDFKILSSSKWQINRLYRDYKESYLNELKKILEEYPDRKITQKYGFVEISAHQPRDDKGGISIPNRIVFYPQLAFSYYKYADVNNMEVNDKNLNYLKQILKTYDLVYEQERNNNTVNYKYVNIEERNRNTYSKIDWNIKRLNYYYPRFIYLYSTKIIQMENELYPESICSDKEIIKKYNSLKKDFNSKNNIIDSILLKCK